MTPSKIQMDQIRSTSATDTGENIRAGSQKKSSLSQAEGLQGESPDATCTCPSGGGSLRHPCPAHPAVEQAEAERPDVVAVVRAQGFGRVCEADANALYQHCSDGETLMSVAQHDASVARWAEMLNRVEQERDAALARVAELEAKLSDPTAVHQWQFSNAWFDGSEEVVLKAGKEGSPIRTLYAAPVAQAQSEETPGEILAAKLIETWVTKHGKPAPWSTAVEITAVATNMPNDERDRLLALDDDVDAQAQHSVPGKYDDVLLPFLKSMEHELHANAGKGDRPGWLQMDRRTALLEIYYHLAKLQKATKDNDAAGIVEYAADVANMSMMLVDVCGLLAAAPGKEEV
ncbi:TPA: hypothetical protein L4E94_000383 [Pseudomonas aeruginosa]|nr:hypothetical protein [Pseudomonas aeruginosa]